MGVTANTELAPTKQDVVTSIVQRELKHQAILAKYCRDVSMFAKKGAKSISFPKFGSFTVEERSSGGEFTTQALTSANDTLNLNIRAGIAWEIDPDDEIQSNVEVQEEYIKRAVSAHGRHFDSKILAKAIAEAGNTAPGAGITTDKIIDMQEFLLNNEAALDRLVMVVSTSVRSALLKNSDFKNASGTGDGKSPLRSGLIGDILGMPVVLHTGLTSGQALIWDFEAIAYGLQRGPKYDEQKNVLLGADGKVAVVNQLYGVEACQIDAGTQTAGTSALIAKLV